MPKSPNIFILNNSEGTILLEVLDKFDYISFEFTLYHNLC